MNVNPVKANLQTSDPEETVQDPVCGKSISRHESKHMVFRETGSYYFCSKDCQQQFLSPTYRPAKSPADKAA